MKKVLLLMKRKSIAQGLMLKLKREDLHVEFASEYHLVNETDFDYDILLIEVPESVEYDIMYCLSLCAQVRENAKKCKIIVMCSENDKESIAQIVKAKSLKSIDDFVFYDVSIDYLVFKLLAQQR